jgi:hypothetical protein
MSTIPQPIVNLVVAELHLVLPLSEAVLPLPLRHLSGEPDE